MKKILKSLLLIVLALATALSMVACDTQTGGGATKKGVYGSVLSSGVYEVRKYYAEEGVDTLDLGKIDLPEGVTEIKIKANAFAENNTLKKIIVSANTVEIGAGAFAKMKKLETLELPYVGKAFEADYKQNASAGAEAGDAERTIAHLFGADEYDGGSSVTVTYGASNTTVYIPASLNNIVINAQKEYNIPMYAFNGVTAFTSIELKGNIVGIGEYAFAGVGGIETFVIPATVKDLYTCAFNASYIKNFVFAEGSADVKVEATAFKNCSLLNFVGAGEIAKHTIDLSVMSVADLGREAFELSANEIEYSVKNASGLDAEKVFGATQIKLN